MAKKSLLSRLMDTTDPDEYGDYFGDTTADDASFEDKITEDGTKSAEESDKWAVSLSGRIFRPVFIIAVGLWAYTNIPTGITTQPIASLTLKDITGLIGSVGLIAVCAIWIFSLPKDDGVYELWGYLAWAIFGLALGFIALYVIL